MGRMTTAIAAMAIGAGSLASVQASAQQQRPPQQGQQQGMDHRGGSGGVGHRQDGGRGPGGPGMDRPSPEAMFAQMDANRDGSVSKAEFTAFHAKHRMGPPPGGRQGPPPRR